VYDKVGKQTRWFQYYLEQQGLKDYYFLAGGAEGYHEAKLGRTRSRFRTSSFLKAALLAIFNSLRRVFYLKTNERGDAGLPVRPWLAPKIKHYGV